MNLENMGELQYAFFFYRHLGYGPGGQLAVIKPVWKTAPALKRSQMLFCQVYVPRYLLLKK